MSSGDWRRKVPGVQWADVWAWLAEIRDEHLLWGEVRLVPPLPCREGKSHGCVVLVLRQYHEGGKARESYYQQELPSPTKASAQDIALQLVARVSQKLDAEKWEAERAADQLGLLL